MTIPLWVWPILCLLCLWALTWLEVRQQNRNAGNWSAIEQERMAREAAEPLGSVSRWVE